MGAFKSQRVRGILLLARIDTPSEIVRVFEAWKVSVRGPTAGIDRFAVNLLDQVKSTLKGRGTGQASTVILKDPIAQLMLLVSSRHGVSGVCVIY